MGDMIQVLGLGFLESRLDHLFPPDTRAACCLVFVKDKNGELIGGLEPATMRQKHQFVKGDLSEDIHPHRIGSKGGKPAYGQLKR